MARNGLLASARAALLVAAAGLLAATLIAFTSNRQLGQSNDELRHTLAVLLAVDDVMALIRDAEGGARGYIISGREEFLDPYRRATPRIPAAIEALIATTREDALVRSEAERLARLIDERHALINGSLITYRTLGKADAEREIAAGRGKRVMDDIRATVAELRRKQAMRGDALKRRHEHEEREAAAATVAAALTGALLAFAGYWFSRRYRHSLELAVREQAEAAARQHGERAARAIMDEAEVAIVVLDDDLRDVYFNARFAQMFGGSPASVIESESVFPPDLVEQRDALLWRFHCDREQGLGEVTYRRPDGERRHATVRWRRLHQPAFPGRYIVTIDDVTELNVARQRIRELAVRLENVRDAQNEETALRLHEGIAQDLFAAKLSVGALSRATASTPGLASACADTEAMITAAITGIRDVMKDLRPGGAAHLPLPRLLESQATEFSRRAGVPVSVDAHARADLPQALKLTLVRAIQEALSNVAKHAHAQQVDVVLREDGRALEVTVSDDGVGLDPDFRNRAGALGLLGIEERLAAFGGALQMESNEPSGTRVRLRVPATGYDRAA
jgi:PAS domain S-box-containing protein